MTYDYLLVSVTEGVGLVTINRPEARNAMDGKAWAELGDAMAALERDPAVLVIIVTGAGGKAFASGADIAALHERTAIEQLGNRLNTILYAITMLEKPVIAAVDGYALGGGCELAMACDIIIATQKSKFGQPETGLGIIPGGGGTQRLQRLVGIGKAKELILTGDIIDAAEAGRIGLVQKVVPDGAVMEAAAEMARKIAKKGPVATRLAKMALNVGANTDLPSGLLFERYAQTVAFATQDKNEGTAAFLEKRPPAFTGE